MQLGTIQDPFSGEKLVEVYPRIAPFVAQLPRLGRLHHFPGRHLTQDHLAFEQSARVQRLELRGQSVSAGIVSGLEVSWHDTSDGVEFHVQPGHALHTTGADRIVDRTLAARLADIPWLGLTPGESPAPPCAAILVLQPGYALDADLPLATQTTDDTRAAATDFTPSPRAVEDEVYYRTTRTDAAQLALYALADAEPFGSLWRNRLAWHLFNLEANHQPMPWLALGVPLALVGFDPSLRPQFVDRHAVARPGGRPRQRNLANPGLDPRAWQARFDHFCSHLAELTDPDPADSHFQFLPPIGLLPKAYLALTRNPGNLTANPPVPPSWSLVQSFFPNGYTIDVCPVPTEQLDALIADHRSLAPFDLSHLDAVRILLPVSQQWFDPDLLKIEIIDPAYAKAIGDFESARADCLADRLDLGERRNTLTRAADGSSQTYPPSPDPKQLESPETPISAPRGESIRFGTVRTSSGGNAIYTCSTLATLRSKAATLLAKFAFSPEDRAEFAELFKACGLTVAQTNAAFAAAPAFTPPPWLTAIVPGVPAGESPLTTPEKDELRRELLAYIKKQLQVQAAEAALVNHPDTTVRKLIDTFSAKADEADHLVDSGFLKVRTDVFRLGHLLGNNALGTKFTASPSLATIIDRKPPKADAAAVNSFASQLLANFAPSAVAAVSGSASTPAPATRDKGDSTASTKGLTSNYALRVDLELPTLDLAAGDIARIQDKVTDLTNEDRKVFEALKKTANYLQSDEFQGFLTQTNNLDNFASRYVENFNLLSQKQIRAIPLDRLQPALAPTVRKEIHDGRLEIFERLTRLDISLGELTTDFVDVPGTVSKPATLPSTTSLTRVRFQTLVARRQLTTLSKLLPSTNEIDDADESKHFASGVSFADMAMAALRAVEKRIQDYRAFVSDCQSALAEIQRFVDQINLALPSAEHELDEARQDLSVARTLAAEEQARLDGINAHREKILRDHLDFLVFHRPRAVDARTESPSRPLQDALLSDPILDCFTENPPAPADLAALRDPVRASPARWFIHAPRWIEKVDRWDHLRSLLERSSRVAISNLDSPPTLGTGRYRNALGVLLDARLSSARKLLSATPRIPPASLLSLSWLDLKREAESKLTLGHLIEAGPASLAKAAAEELDRLFIVATCLHQNFSLVPGIIRLAWTERFSQFDQVTVDFRDLSRLPNWHRLDFNLRRECQMLVDWLYGRVNQDLPDALDLIHDLVRVALLLASHAPVDQLIVGQPIDNNLTPVLGGLIQLKVDPSRIRRGMEVTHRINATQTLHATVEDISASHVSARILQLPTTPIAPLGVGSVFYFR